MASQGIFPRRIKNLVLKKIENFPVVMLHGPRSVGKSTLLRDIASIYEREVLDLDNLDKRDQVALEPSQYVSGRRPVLIDEYQKVVEILDWIKVELNKDGSPGQFVLTGSARPELLISGLQALTGRVIKIPILPLSQVEIERTDADFISAAFEDIQSLCSIKTSDSTRGAYVKRVLMGGFPLALSSIDQDERGPWFDAFERRVNAEDIRNLVRIQQPAVLPQFLRRLVAQTGQSLNITRAGRDVGIKQSTASNYAKLLEAVFILDLMPAWRKKATGPVHHPKVYMVDSGFAGRLLGLTEEKLLVPDNLASSQFGHLLETFVVGEVRKMVSWTNDYEVGGYWRDSRGMEVDLIVERQTDGAVIAIEVKATTRVSEDDLKSIRLLRDEIGSHLIAGVVLYTGEYAYQVEEGIYALPIDKLWQGNRQDSTAAKPTATVSVDASPQFVALGREVGVTDDPLPDYIRVHVEEMLEQIQPGASAWWEIAVTPSEEIRFSDFYSMDGMSGAFERIGEEQIRSVFGLGIGPGVNVETIGPCVALIYERKKGVLLHPGGTMVALAIVTADFLADAPDHESKQHEVVYINKYALQGFALDFASLARRELLAKGSNSRWTYWTVGRNLQNGHPVPIAGWGYFATYQRQQLQQGILDPDHLVGKAVVDSPYHKPILCSNDPEVDAFNLYASFLEWFGISSRGLPEAETGRISIQDFIKRTGGGWQGLG